MILPQRMMRQILTNERVIVGYTVVFTVVVSLFLSLWLVALEFRVAFNILVFNPLVAQVVTTPNTPKTLGTPNVAHSARGTIWPPKSILYSFQQSFIIPGIRLLFKKKTTLKIIHKPKLNAPKFISNINMYDFTVAHQVVLFNISWSLWSRRYLATSHRFGDRGIYS